MSNVERATSFSVLIRKPFPSDYRSISSVELNVDAMDPDHTSVFVLQGLLRVESQPGDIPHTQMAPVVFGGAAQIKSPC
jgi:hypothetical protein